MLQRGSRQKLPLRANFAKQKSITARAVRSSPPRRHTPDPAFGESQPTPATGGHELRRGVVCPLVRSRSPPRPPRRQAAPLLLLLLLFPRPAPRGGGRAAAGGRRRRRGGPAAGAARLPRRRGGRHRARPVSAGGVRGAGGAAHPGERRDQHRHQPRRGPRPRRALRRRRGRLARLPLLGPAPRRRLHHAPRLPLHGLLRRRQLPARPRAARGLLRLPRALPLRTQELSRIGANLLGSSIQGFRRANGVSDVRAMYLHSVLTCRSGSALMLALIYSEILKTVRIYGLLDFDAEIFFPTDPNGLPRGYDKQKSKLGDEPHIITSKSLLVGILKTLKATFWPFQSNQSSSLFLNAVAANHYGPGTLGDNQTRSHGNISAIEMAAAKAAQHRLMRGVWTNVRFGDMRRALAACERLILLQHDPHELRDYAALLYHCGYYEECLQYLSSYQTALAGQSSSNRLEILEDEAVNTLRARVTLILAEDGWSSHRPAASYWTKNSEPW